VSEIATSICREACRKVFSPTRGGIRQGWSIVGDLVFVLLTAAVFALIGLLVKAMEKL